MQRRLQRWFGRDPDRHPSTSEGTAESMAVPEPPAKTQVCEPFERAMDLAQPAAEQLAEDERLRGSLTDEGFEPLLTWMTQLLIAAAERGSAGPEATHILEQAGTVARDLTRAIVAAAESGDTSAVAGEIKPPLFSPDEAARAKGAVLQSLAAADDPNARARALVAALSAVVSGAARDAP